MVDRNLSESDDEDYEHYYNANELRLFFKTLQGDSEEFTVTKDTNIGDFKKKYIEEVMRVKPSSCSDISFLLYGKTLNPSKTFGEYDISDDETIHIIIRPSGC